ncbi:LytTR family two component transcriptional regulator [Paracidovorax anthurii]|uniref:LytTR family two component transcriptional regulator n=3 Tax=Paracidovorax anthurii TaxID=78229 RepID=A0A328YHB5_9BURK|nr:LytTR family DNA-binding domain-containing protein [Paracidovorax anthurii]RAR72940.1 LytTR family two component transcriptional regulator [Paracidovorax anthurii]
MHILIVDDEALARSRLRTLLADCGGHTVAEAANAAEALAQLRATAGGRACDAVLLDIHMPGQDGLALAHTLRTLAQPPAIVFVTAHADHAVSAFELDAVDYLTKPVRLERLQQALAKVRRTAGQPRPEAAPGAVDGESLLIQDRGRTERVPLDEVLYVKAELKYLTVRTGTRSYILDGSLSEMETRYADRFLRVHRNALVARRALRALEKHYDPDEGEGWAVRLHGLPELLSVSRRQVAAVREALSH